MTKLLTACFLALGLMAGQAYAANPACEKSADDKKLAGAARTSHIKKCEADMGAGGNAACEKSASDKKLAGAARTSHIKKCMEDAGKPAAAAAPAAPAKK
ncbi:MAG: hypothetical protein IPM15_21780 [Betaproteobacteria bacterium]|nr:hypothetical protein [Betaproteobacteria bacterium]MCC6249566.1 hypothetical protein [Rubrivivax sp.]MCL4696064.1 hypothetical protein [Burkholderiaceae bacterium]